MLGCLASLVACRSSGDGAGRPTAIAPKGMLEFRVLAGKADDDAYQYAAFRDVLAKDGPAPVGDNKEYGWFQIADPPDFFKTKDAKGEFDRIRKEVMLVVEQRGDDFFILAHTAKDLALTRGASDSAWSIESASVIRTTHGAVSIIVELDDRGAAMIEKLTQAYRGKTLGVFLDGKVIMHFPIMDVIHKSIHITGPFTWGEAENTAKLIREASGGPPS